MYNNMYVKEQGIYHEAQARLERVPHGHNVGTIGGKGEFTDGLEIG
jgi:hypothetical protein